MEKGQILVKVQDVFRDILDDEELVIKPETTANDVDDWDSLTHVQLVVGMEKAFGIKFTAQEIISWKNIGEMIESILAKL